MTDTQIARTTEPRPSELVQDDLPDVTSTGDFSPAAQPTLEDLEEALKDVVDPELGINVVDLGLIYGLHLEDDGTLTIDMTLTSAAWMPPWGLEKITDDGRDQLRALGFNV